MKLKKLIKWAIKFVCTKLYKTEYVGLENIDDSKRYVFAANHVASLDPAFVMYKVDDLAIMAKAELFKIPVVKNVVKACGAFPINRGKKDVKSVLHATNVIKKDNKNLLIFPEGTRKAVQKQAKGKDGAVCIAASAGVDIIPVYLPEQRKFFKKCVVKIGEPIQIEEEVTKDRKKLKETTAFVMEKIYSMR